ncbi:MAG: hypothetical protein A2157_04395 [Deltaproteobacteria bacterium RBG_16_47_11]|nr:MAG: hypothetical protein A2157_04395 [Deltaproteobacteria bacterium RBG_16_47_11]
MIGGIPSLKSWIGFTDPNVYVLPFPNCFRCPCDRLTYEGCEQECFSLGEVMFQELHGIWDTFPAHIGYVQGAGLVWAIHMVKDGTRESNPELAFDVVRRAIQKGLMLTGPLGPNYGTIKIMPPLTITEEAIRDGALTLREAIHESL